MENDFIVTSSDTDYIPVTGFADGIQSIDNQLNYSGAFWGLAFAIGVIAGLLFAKFSSWRG